LAFGATIVTRQGVARRIVWKGFLALGISVPIAWVIVPLLWLVLTSLKPFHLYFAPPRWWFRPSFEHYRWLFLNNEYLSYFVNSCIVASCATVGALGLGSLMGYVLARLQFWGQNALLFLILLTRMYPPVTTVIPIYFIANWLGLRDTKTVLVILNMAFQLPLVIWMMRAFFQEIPVEIEEAALIDGCSPFQSFLRVSLPLALPGALASGLLAFIFSWNEYLFALVLSVSDAKTLPVAISEFREETNIQWGQMSALGVATILPMVLFMILTKRYLVRGLSYGAVKG